MPAVKFSPVLNDQIITATGAPAVGWKILSYQAGTSTPLATYTTSTGNVAHGNPEQIDTLGYVQQGPLWLESGKSYKLVLTDANDAVQKTIDNVSGVNDTSTSTSEWIDTGLTPTYISVNSFSVQGDQTSTYHVGRRMKFQTTGGTVYGRIVTSLFASSITTVTMKMDGTQVLDSGLSVAQPSFLRADVLALPERIATTAGTDAYTATIGIARNVQGAEYKIKFANSNRIINPTLQLDAGGALPIVSTSGSALSIGALNGEHIIRDDGGTNYILLNPAISYVPRGFIDGLTLSTAGASATMGISAGAALDSTNLALMVLGTAMTKTAAVWALGTGVGALDAGTIRNSALGATCSFATNIMTCTVAPTSGTFQVGQEIKAEGIPPGTTISSLGTGVGGTGTYNLSTSPGTLAARPAEGMSWYHWFLIRNLVSNIVDLLFSLSPTAPTLPPNYTVSRRIGSAKTNGLSQWTKFIQNGDYFELDVPTIDISASVLGAGSRTLVNSGAPTGITAEALFYFQLVSSGSNVRALLSNPATTDNAVGNNNASMTTANTSNAIGGGQVRCRTNSSAQVGVRGDSGATYFLSTLGWTDQRGKNA